MTEEKASPRVIRRGSSASEETEAIRALESDSELFTDTLANGRMVTLREMTAGDLWQFFSDRGIDSVENLTICMDWAPGQELGTDIDVSSLQLRIEDPSHAGSLLTNVSLGGHSLVVPGFEVSSFKPEAKLGVVLAADA